MDGQCLCGAPDCLSCGPAQDYYRCRHGAIWPDCEESDCVNSDFEPEEESEETMTAEEIRDECLAWLKIHRQECEGPCFEPIGLLAFLGHCMGLKATEHNLAILCREMIVVENRCPDCQHLRN